MGSFFAILSRTGNINIATILSNAMEVISCWPHNHSYRRIDSNVAIGCHYLITQFNSTSIKTHDYELNPGYSIIADARIDYKEELADQLGMELQELLSYSDSSLILRSYIEWGSKCLDYLYGDFAFVIYNKSLSELFCVRDHFGCRPLYYIDEQDFFAVATDVKAFKVIPGFPLIISDKCITDSICSIYPEKEESGFNKIKRLQPAHYLQASLNGPSISNSFWDLRVHKDYEDLTENEATSKLRQLFVEAVNQRVKYLDKGGVELSGGLDSSGILSCLVKEKLCEVNKVHTFSHVANPSYKVNSENDERLYIDHLHQELDIKNRFFINDYEEAGAFTALEKALLNLYKPFIQGFSVLSDLLYKKAKTHSIRVILSGFGGDEAVTNSGYGTLQELVKKRQIWFVKHLLHRNTNYYWIKYLRLLGKYYILLIAPWMIRRKKRKNRHLLVQSFALEKNLVKQFNTENRFKDQIFYPQYPDLKQRQRYRIGHSYLIDRLENSYFNAKSYGIEYRYPFLDVKLIEFYYSIKSIYKYKYGITRYAFRKALEGIIDDKIRLRQDKSGLQIPHIYSRINKDTDMFLKLIVEGRENNRFHYVDYDKLLNMIESNNNQNDRYFMQFPRSFLSAVSVLILQKWQREGKIDIGIKC